MKIAGISFTRAGSQRLREILKGLEHQGEKCSGYISERFLSEEEEPWIHALEKSVRPWTEEQFKEQDALIYIGAAGIAVRAIAPCLRDKMTDPAVLVADEQGHFVISLLSGHIGGANRLTERVAEILGAQPVVTTASDVQGKTAIDEWAKEHDLLISDRESAKETAAAVVNGERVGFFSDFPIEGKIPDGYEWQTLCSRNVWVTDRLHPLPSLPSQTEKCKDLRLIPKSLTIGIGCRKGTSLEAIRTAVRETFEKEGFDLRSAVQIASIDLKKEEAGLCEFARERNLPFVTYSSEELLDVEGDFTESSFVRQVTGVGNVCERSAIFGARSIRCGQDQMQTSWIQSSQMQNNHIQGNQMQNDRIQNKDVRNNKDVQNIDKNGADAELVIRKTARNGVTVAAARTRLTIKRKTEQTETARDL